MSFAAYARGKEERGAVSWKDFRAAFVGCEVVEDQHDDRGGRWVITHPLHSVRVYSPVTGLFSKTTGSAHFDDYDVAPIWNIRGLNEHPFWEGLYRLVQEVGMVLTVKLPFAEGLVVGSAHSSDPLPSWADRYYVFSCSSSADIKRVMITACELEQRMQVLRESRAEWADANERDEEALTAFRNFILGKRGKRPKFEWAGQVLRFAGAPGSFLDAYGIMIDWRDVDADAIECFSDALKHDKLSAKELDTGLSITIMDRTKEISLEDIGTDRYNALRALNSVLAPEYEVRLVRNSADGDTHCFTLAPTWLWQELESEHAEKTKKKFKVIDAKDSF